MTLYGQTLYGSDGLCGVDGCETREEAVEVVVGMAIGANYSPPRWWHFRRTKWPADCVAEYERRKADD